MKLEAVWFKGGKEVHKVSPVMCIVCGENMNDILEIEIEDEHSKWHSCEENNFEADDFEIRVKWK